MGCFRGSPLQPLAQGRILPRAATAAVGVLVASCRCGPAAEGGRGVTTAPAASARAAHDAGTEVALAQTEAGPAATARDAAPALEPLAASGPLVQLEVPEFRAAVVSVPLGATSKRPVVVALHGNFDRPEWQCEVWRDITAAHPFVLCPRGIPRGDAPKKWDRWTYGAMIKTKQELMAGLEALKMRFGEYIAEGPVIFTGFSLGAILGRYIIKEHPELFSRVVFTEGGYKGWEWLARAFKQGGGERVLFACGQPGCVAACKAAGRRAKAVQLETRIADGGKAGHTYDGTVAAAILAHWDWLVGGDQRWPQAPPGPGVEDAAAE